MTTILHIIDSLGTGGSEMMLYKLITTLSRDQYRNIVFVLNQDDSLLSKFQEKNIEVHNIKCSVKTLRRLVKQIQPDIIYGWLYRSLFWAWLARRFAPKAKLIWGIRSSLYCYSKMSLFSRIALRVLGLFSHCPDKIIYNSQISREQHTQMGFVFQNTDVIANGFELNPITPLLTRETLGIRPEDFVVGIVARVHPEKGYDVFLRIAQQFLQSNPATQFILVGKGTENLLNTMPEFFAQNSLKNHCHFLGERHDAQAIMTLFDVAVCPSHTEAFPNVVGEAMLCAIPVVVTNVGDARYLVGNSDWLFEANHVDHALALLTSLNAMTTEERQAIGKQHQRRIHANFSIDTIGEQYAGLFQSLIRE